MTQLTTIKVKVAQESNSTIIMFARPWIAALGQDGDEPALSEGGAYPRICPVQRSMIQTPLEGPGQTDSVAEQRVQAESWLNILKGT